MEADKSGRAFVIRPFGKKINKRGEEIDFELVHENLILPALAQLGISGGTTGEFLQQGMIHEDMFREITSADLVVADISVHNANAFYELGIRHALRDRFTVMIRGDKHYDDHVFDLKPERYMKYSVDDPGSSVDKLVSVIKATLASEVGDSPVFRLLPGLSPIDLTRVVVVPAVFCEAVERALAENTEEALLVLKNQALRQSWEREGLRAIARAQSDNGDHENALVTWEQLREYDSFNVEANRQLATHYQKTGKYTESDIAASRCLNNLTVSDWDRAEVHSLIGSNHKTRWRDEFAELPELEDRQRAALASDQLEKSYVAYHDGFEYHRSHYYSGLNAVNMLSIQLALASLYGPEWEYMFDSERKAEFELTERQHLLKKLQAATELAIASAIKIRDDDWARISRADLLLITGRKPDRVRVAYARCKAAVQGFNAQSVRHQFQLYQSLGLFGDNTDAALEGLK